MTGLEIQAAGGDTATPLNLQKRLDWISRRCWAPARQERDSLRVRRG